MPEDRIERARNHVIAGRLIVHRQRERIACGEVNGPDAQRLLKTFETSLKILEDELARLLARRGERSTGAGQPTATPTSS